MNQPIIVLGKERSGTKWLSNLIANHPEVACVQSNYHNGILETNMFDKMEMVFGNLEINENRIAFEHVFVNTSFFKITGINPNWVSNSNYQTYLELFRLLMDEYAHKKLSKTWVQKANSLLAKKLLLNYPDSKFIIIQRELMENVASTLNMGDYSFSLKTVISSVFGHVYNEKFENNMRNKDNVLIVSYEKLKINTETYLENIYDFLNLTFDPKYCKVSFEKNTSFQTKQRKKFNNTEKLIIKMFYLIASIMPFFLLKMFRNILHKTRKNETKFVAGTFSL